MGEIPTKCFICLKMCCDLNDLTLHFSTEHLSKRSQECSMCHTQFKNIYQLQQHVKKGCIVNSTEVHKCQICAKLFFTKIDMVHHLPLHFTQRILPCNLCGGKFTLPNHLYSHLNIAHGFIKDQNEIQNYPCALCDFTSSSVQVLTMHYSMQHKVQKDNNIHKCEICTMTFPSYQSLKTHETSHHQGHKQFTNECPMCSFLFHSVGLLHNHLETHANGEHQCPNCLLRFGAAVTLACHKQMKKCDIIRQNMAAKNGNKKMVECCFCDKKFFAVEELCRHHITHLSESETVKCLTENELNKFNNSKKVIRDIEIVNRNGVNDPYLFSCHICHRKFKYEFSLEAHLTSHKE